MAYGLKVYKSGTNSYLYTQTAAGIAAPAQALSTLVSAYNSDNSGMASTRSDVWGAFTNCVYALAIPPEATIKYWMTAGLGASRNSFISHYYGLYVNGTASYRANILNDRKIANSTLSPYPMNQNDNEVVIGALSTSNLTSLFIGTSNYNIPDHDTSYSFGTNTVGSWNYDQVKSYGGGSNTVAQYGTILQSSQAPNMLGTTGFAGTGSYCEVTTSTNAWNFANGTNFTIELYFQTNYWSSQDETTILSTPDNSILIKLARTPNLLIIKLGAITYTIPNYNDSVAYKYATGVCYHLAITRNGTTVRIFIDGEMILEQSGNTESMGATTKLTFAGNSGGATNWYTGFLSSPRIVRGKSIYNSAFPKITRRAKHSRGFVLQQMTKAGTAPFVYPQEENIQYHRLNGITSYTGGTQFSSEDISWNLVSSFKLAASTSADNYFSSCKNREVTVVQTILGSPSITTSYSVGEWFHTPSSGRVYIYPSAVETYNLILMK